MLEKCLTLKVMLKPAPAYSMKSLRNVSHQAEGVSANRKMTIFLGTIKRIVKGKI